MSITHTWIDVDMEGPVRQTDLAEYHSTEAGLLWIPKSVIGARNLKTGRIEVARWWAEKNGLADEKDGF